MPHLAAVAQHSEEGAGGGRVRQEGIHFRRSRFFPREWIGCRRAAKMIQRPHEQNPAVRIEKPKDINGGKLRKPPLVG